MPIFNHSIIYFAKEQRMINRYKAQDYSTRNYFMFCLSLKDAVVAVMKVYEEVCKHEDVKDRNDNEATTNETKEMNICYFKAARVKVKTPTLAAHFVCNLARERNYNWKCYSFCHL